MRFPRRSWRSGSAGGEREEGEEVDKTSTVCTENLSLLTFIKRHAGPAPEPMSRYSPADDRADDPNASLFLVPLSFSLAARRGRRCLWLTMRQKSSVIGAGAQRGGRRRPRCAAGQWVSMRRTCVRRRPMRSVEEVYYFLRFPWVSFTLASPLSNHVNLVILSNMHVRLATQFQTGLHDLHD